MTVTGLATGAADLDITFEFGTPNPDPVTDPTGGFDGLTWVNAGSSTKV